FFFLSISVSLPPILLSVSLFSLHPPSLQNNPLPPIHTHTHTHTHPHTQHPTHTPHPLLSFNHSFLLFLRSHSISLQPPHYDDASAHGSWPCPFPHSDQSDWPSAE